MPGLDREVQRKELGTANTLHRENQPGLTKRQGDGPEALPAGLSRQGGGRWNLMIGTIQEIPRGHIKV